MSGIVVRRARGDVALAPAEHLIGAGIEQMLAVPDDAPFLVPVALTRAWTIGAHASVTGTWTGDGIDTSRIAPSGPVPGPDRHGSAAVRAWGASNVARASPDPPPSLVWDLLDTGEISSMLPMGDGTLRVTSEAPDRVRALLARENVTTVEVAAAWWTAEERSRADAVAELAERLGVLCGQGSGSHPRDPAQLVHTLEVAWAPPVLARAAATVPADLLDITSHLTVLPDAAPDGEPEQSEGS